MNRAATAGRSCAARGHLRPTRCR